MSEAVVVEALKQAPTLGVLLWVVWYFMRSLEAVHRELFTAMRENTATSARVAESLEGVTAALREVERAIEHVTPH